MKFRDRIALARQLDQRSIEQRGVEGEVACLRAIDLTSRHRLPGFIPRASSLRAHPLGEVRQP
jgi:hypothetical protein